MRFASVRILRSEHHQPVVDVGEWEIPLLEYEYAPEKVQVLEIKVDDRPYPEARDEFARLSTRYGEDVDSGNPKVALVYGQGMMGVNALANIIQQSQQAEAAALADAESAKVEEAARAAAEEARVAQLVEQRAAALVAERTTEKSKTLSLNK